MGRRPVESAGRGQAAWRGEAVAARRAGRRMRVHGRTGNPGRRAAGRSRRRPVSRARGGWARAGRRAGAGRWAARLGERQGREEGEKEGRKRKKRGKRGKGKKKRKKK